MITKVITMTDKKADMESVDTGTFRMLSPLPIVEANRATTNPENANKYLICVFVIQNPSTALFAVLNRITGTTRTIAGQERNPKPGGR